MDLWLFPIRWVVFFSIMFIRFFDLVWFISAPHGVLFEKPRRIIFPNCRIAYTNDHRTAHHHTQKHISIRYGRPAEPKTVSLVPSSAYIYGDCMYISYMMVTIVVARWSLAAGCQSLLTKCRTIACGPIVSSDSAVSHTIHLTFLSFIYSIYGGSQAYLRIICRCCCETCFVCTSIYLHIYVYTVTAYTVLSKSF